jgi:hypothetical protein
LKKAALGGGVLFQSVRLTFNGLHGVISHKLQLFITTAVRTSDPAMTGLFFL